MLNLRTSYNTRLNKKINLVSTLARKINRLEDLDNRLKSLAKNAKT